MVDLITQLFEKDNELTRSIQALRKSGSTLAQKEYDYKVALSQRVLEMKDEGMPSTLINLTIYGDKKVARLRLERDIADVTYKANLEHINVTKLQMKILEEQIKREWGKDMPD